MKTINVVTAPVTAAAPKGKGKRTPKVAAPPVVEAPAAAPAPPVVEAPAAAAAPPVVEAPVVEAPAAAAAPPVVEAPAPKGISKATYGGGLTVTLKTLTNPKKAGSAAFDRFEKYVTGASVTDTLKAGLTREDLRWDVKHGFITVA